MKMKIICSETDNKFLDFENFNSAKQTDFDSEKRIVMDPVKKSKVLTEVELNNNSHIEPEEEYEKIEEGERAESLLEDEEKDQKDKNGAIIFPYTIKTEDKVELAKGTNVWILKTDLQRIEGKCEFIRCDDRHRTMTRFLLLNLLGSQNFKNMSVGVGGRNGKIYIPLPKEVYSAVRSYVIKDCKNSVCQTTILKCNTYRHYIANVFKNARRNPVTEIVRGRYTGSRNNEIMPTPNGFLPNTTNLNQIVFPYMIWNEKKVEIILQTNVWIYKAFLNIIKETWRNKQSLMTQNLLRHLLGPENMKYMTLNGTWGTIPMPSIVYFAIRTFVVQNCTPDAQLSTMEFEDCINDTFAKSRENLQQIAVDKSTSTAKISSKTMPKKYFPAISPNYFGNSLTNNFQANFPFTSEIRELNSLSHNKPQNDIKHENKRRKLSSDNYFVPQGYSFPEAEYHLQQYVTPVNFGYTLPHYPLIYYDNFWTDVASWAWSNFESSEGYCRCTLEGEEYAGNSASRAMICRCTLEGEEYAGSR
ncbi:uncharacterized protein LOC117181107 [Belonocnema kinseyi]|uniref:uncharacterized protein LOC117181107 n=1 Tax=Belonocnema kinseyi TaxID=2817044 RepID=UPI00143DEBE7|nr:uncharacterized protein LOC117181107 [Belonocnema kinseyi]